MESDRQLLMLLHGCGPRYPVELPAPSLAIVAVAVARRRPQRRLPRCPLPRPLPRAPVELLASLRPRTVVRRLRVGVLARVAACSSGCSTFVSIGWYAATGMSSV